MESARWQAVAALVDPVRRALYDYVRRQDHPVTREEAADAEGISRHLAAFHLDKLVEVGLLVARYEAPEGLPRGRGRTPKVYEPAENGLSLSIPERRYELIAAILTEAIAEKPTDAGEAARRQARSRGTRYGRQFSSGQSGKPLTVAAKALTELGFEPDQEQPDLVILRNCPFHALAVNQPELVCGLNHSFIQGLIRGLDAGALTSHLVPRPGACCVEIRTSDRE